MHISMVAAFAKGNRAIGVGNTLPWDCPEDMAHFVALTKGKVVLMGRKTAESIGRALPGRNCIVLTTKGRSPVTGMTAISGLLQLKGLVEALGATEVVVIGGEAIYRLMMPYADSLHLTELNVEVEGADAFFPEVVPDQWKLTGNRPFGMGAFTTYWRRGGIAKPLPAGFAA